MRNFLVGFLSLTILFLIYIPLLISANHKVETKCAAAGGQVLTQPGGVSRCLRPAK